MLKKFFLPLVVSLVAFSSLFFISTSVYASTPVYKGRSGSDCGGFLGLTSWDCGVNVSDQDSLKAGVWTIATNILADIVVVAAYLVLGYVIYGGYLYTMSGGDPGKVATGKKTLSQAFIGLAIVMSAHVIMTTIRFALLGGDTALNCNLETGANCVNPGTIVSNAIQWAIGITGIVAAIFVVYGGIGYITSGGDPGKLQKAKSTILYALLGLVIVALAEIITAFVTNMINEANTKTEDTAIQAESQQIVTKDSSLIVKQPKEAYENKIN